MKNTVLSAALALAASLTASAATPVQSGPEFKDNITTQQVVQEFVAAYAQHDTVALARATTKDFKVRFYRSRPISQVTVSSARLARSWREAPRVAPASDTVPAPVALYPTSDTNVLVVTYRVSNQPEAGDRIALLELRGHRVSHMSDFPGSDESTPMNNGDFSVAAN